MAERPSRRRIRDLNKSERAENSSVLSTRPGRVRSRSVLSDDRSVDQWSDNRLLYALKDHGLVLPKSTLKASLLRIYKQLKTMTILP